MPKLTRNFPKYSHLNGVGFYWKDGKRHYLPGQYNSQVSLAAYHNAMAEISRERAFGSPQQTQNRKKISYQSKNWLMNFWHGARPII